MRTELELLVVGFLMVLVPPLWAVPADAAEAVRRDLLSIQRGEDTPHREKIINRWLSSQIEWARRRIDRNQMVVTGGRDPEVISLGLSQAAVIVLLQSDDPEDVELGRTVLGTVLPLMQVTDRKRPDFGGYCYAGRPGADVGSIGQAFAMCHYTWMYLNLKEQMGPELAEKLRRSLQMAIEWEMKYENKLWYSNAEMQNMASLLVASDLFDHKPGQAKGRELFDRWCDWQLRIGLVNEYNCPGYGQPQLAAISLVAAGAKDPAVALRAMLMQERLLLQHSSFFFPPTQRAAGPNKRRYSGLLYQTAYVNEVLAREVPGIRLDEDRSNVSLCTIQDYNVPDYFLPILFKQEFPYRICARTELKEDHEGDAVCYMTPHYAMGAAGRGRTLQWGNIGNHLSVLYPRAQGPDGGTGWGFAIVRFHSDGGPESGFDLWMDKGNTLCLQQDNVAIGMSRACLFDSVKLYSKYHNVLGSAQKEKSIVGYPAVTTLAMDVAFITDGADPRSTTDVWVAGEPVKRFPYESDTDREVVVRDTGVLVGVRPIDIPDLGRARRLVINWLSYHGRPALLVRYPIYDGKPRDFTISEVRRIAGALALEAASAKEPGAEEAFIRRMGQGRIAVAGQRGQRTTYTYASAGTELKATYDFEQDRWLKRTINGKPFHAPVWASNDALHSDSGLISLRGVSVRTRPGLPVWAIVLEHPRCAVLYNANYKDTPAEIDMPPFRLRMDSLGLGKVVCRKENGSGARVEIVSLARPHGTVQVPDGPPTVTWNGHELPVEAGPRADTFQF